MSEESRKEQVAPTSTSDRAESSKLSSQSLANSHGANQGREREDWEATLEDLNFDETWDQTAHLSLSDVSKLASTSDVRGRYRHFQSKRADFWRAYARRGDERTEPVEENLHFFGDWAIAPSQRAHIDWPKQEVNTSGIYFRWNGLGIALNPSASFLEDFHKRGLFIGDLNAVISTRPDTKVHEVLEKIYTLNATFNEVSESKHKIDYYLCAATHKELFHRLEPRYKQERNSVFCLERYVDSDDVETHDLGQGVQLSYCYAPRDAEAGVVFHLALPNVKAEPHEEGLEALQTQALKIGYLPKSLCSTFPKALFGDCHLLILSLTSFNSDTLESAQKSKAAELDLEPLVCALQKGHPKVALLCDFSIQEGDLRLEIAKHLKGQINEKNAGDLTPILPADGQLELEMATWRIRCAVTGHWIPAPFTNVIRTEESFGPLIYLGSDCVL